MNGVHTICFDNTMSRWTPKVVSFRLSSSGTQKTKDFAHLEHLGPMVDSVIKISEELDQIEKLQHTMRVREQSHRDSRLLLSFLAADPSSSSTSPHVR